VTGGVTPTVVVVAQRHSLDSHQRDHAKRRVLAALDARGCHKAVHQLAIGSTVIVSEEHAISPTGVTHITCPGIGGTNSLHSPAALVDVQGDRVTIRTDGPGLKHVYVTETRDHFAASTSAGVLASFAGAQLDEGSVAQLALLGFLLGTRSLFEGVSLLEVGTAVTLSHGSMRISQQDARGVPQARSGCDAIRRSVADLLEGSPEAVLELSGGLDSRVILAAMTRVQRRGRIGFTIDSGDGTDARIARALAVREGLEHVVVSGQPWSGRDPMEVHERVQRAARVREFATNALAGATLDIIEELAPPGARLTGVNGEYVRGFYHPGTLPREQVSRPSVRRVLHWRMLTNDRVSDSLLQPEWRSHQVNSLVDSLNEDLRTRSHWLRIALDEFYLHQRVRRWAGPSYSKASVHRRILAPFLHPAFLNWAASTSISERAGSRALARVLCELEPELGRMPLADGLTPAQISASGASDRVRALNRRGAKVIRKVEQRLRASRRPPSGSAEILDPLTEAWSIGRPFEGLSRLPFLAQGQLERWHDDPSSLDSSTASFLVNLSGSLNLLRSTAADHPFSSRGVLPGGASGGGPQ
jgi:asparagine synthase (glutamine-hydrolysing)